MSKTLIVVESPSKIKTIQKYLGSEYIIRATVGHIMDLASHAKNKIGIDIENGFKPTYTVIHDKKDKIKAIQDAATMVDKIYIASDPDREGSAIAHHVLSQLKTKLPVKRVLFHEITKKGIEKGLADPQELDKNSYQSQQARRVLDRLVGFMVSPYLINTLGPKLSAGRVQSVAIRMVVDREREIENFKPDEYWSITAALAKSKDDEKFIAKYNNKITNKIEAEKIKKDLDSDSYKILEVLAEEKKKFPPPPLETATLQQLANLKYRLDSKRTMSAAQSLYQNGHITYLRSDSVRCSPESITSLREWLKTSGFELPIKAHEYAAKGNSQDAHEAIRPTVVNFIPSKSGFKDDELKVYTLIWERFVASQMLPAVFDTCLVTVESSSKHILKSSGRILKSKGWLEVCTDFSKKDDEEELKLPDLKQNDEVVLVPPKVKAEQKFTQPPPRYKEHSLIKELKKRGIGRPSTYASIMTKLSDRAYIEKKKDVFYPTEVGKKVVDNLVQFFEFMKVDYTKDMEDKLDLIAEGKLKYLDMMTDFFTPFKEELKKAYSSQEKDYNINCFKCSSKMKLRHGKFGYYMICEDFNCSTSQSCDIVDGLPVFKSSQKAFDLVDGIECPECKAGMVVRAGKFGKFYACSKYPGCKGTAKIPFGKKCSDCKSELYITIFDGIEKLACMGFPNCRHVEDLPEEYESDWIDPEKLKYKKSPYALKKVIKPSSQST
jgi:DNA topoisomerase-1